jgi:hypothetical protein
MTGTESPDPLPNKATTWSASADGKEELSAYLEYNKILRSWFVAFGVGRPALFLINAQLGKRTAGNLPKCRPCSWLARAARFSGR